MAHIVDHLNQVVHVNNILLVDLQEVVVERQQVGALHIAFQFDGLLVSATTTSQQRISWSYWNRHTSSLSTTLKSTELV